MKSYCGRQPCYTRNTNSIRARVSGVSCVFLFLINLLPVTDVWAQQDIPLTLAAAEDIALDQEPGRAALAARASALEETSVAAGQLPDPVLRTGIANYPTESGGFTTEAMTQAQLGIRQAFPPGGSLAANARKFESLALEMKENADGRNRDVLAAVRQAWLETYYWERAHEIVDESRPFFSDLVSTTRSLYSVGRKDQQDLLRAELELSRIDARLIEINNNHMRAIAALSQWVGRDSARPIAKVLPEWREVPTLAELRSGLMTHPAINAANARIDAREAGVDFAERNLKPAWALDLGYGHRNGTLPNGDPRSDFISLSLSMDLPVLRKNRQSRHLSAALSERRAANESKEELVRRLNSQLEAEYARWIDLNRHIKLYETQILSLADENAQSALRAYQSDAGDFADVMRGYIDSINTRVEHIRLQVDRAQSFAVLANLGGLRR